MKKLLVVLGLMTMQFSSQAQKKKDFDHDTLLVGMNQYMMNDLLGRINERKSIVAYGHSNPIATTWGKAYVGKGFGIRNVYVGKNWAGVKDTLGKRMFLYNKYNFDTVNETLSYQIKDTIILFAFSERMKTGKLFLEKQVILKSKEGFELLTSKQGKAVFDEFIPLWDYFGDEFRRAIGTHPDQNKESKM